MTGKRRHILDLDDFSAEEITGVFSVAEAMREVMSRPVKKTPALRGKVVATLFYEPSTRTKVSFDLAAKMLSAEVLSLQPQTTSVAKGESLIDTVCTLEALGVDILILRHPSSGAPYLAAQNTSLNIINAGDGWHAHPTQALLDLYTIWRHKGSLEGLKVTIVGDIKHSRVARSNIWGLATMGAKVTLCCPYTLLPANLGNTGSLFPEVSLKPDIYSALDGADVVMTLRLQTERQACGDLPSIREYIGLYQINEERLKLAKKDAVLLHPGPVNEDIELASTCVYGPNSLIKEQVTNGVAVRMALLYLLSQGWHK